MSKLRIHVIGAAGQLGRALVAGVTDGGSAPGATSPDAQISLIPYTSADLDITDAASVQTVLAGLTADDVVINCAAYTNVDGAESDRRAAFAVNADGPANLAAMTAATGARLIHISTDYVFSGVHERPRTQPLEPADLSLDGEPATVYGASKLAGERAVRERDQAAVVVRTAWVYTGGPTATDFVGTMRRLERDRETISVVNDQTGSPTYAPDLAAGLLELAANGVRGDTAPGGDLGGAALHGILHGTNAGAATWYDLAREVFELVGADPDRVHPCTTEEFPRPAPRPSYSVLSSSSWVAAGLTPLRDWRTALRVALA